MKRWIAGVIALCIMMGTAAAAEVQTQDEQLQAVTRQVKTQLGIGDDYASFYGQLEDNGLDPYWDLQWEAKGDRIDVNVSRDGVIRWYSHSTDADNTPYDSGFSPQLPKATWEQAEQAAQAFVKRVLAPGETAVFDASADGIRPLDTERFYLYGTMYYNGLPTPVSLSVNVRASDLTVYRYSRDAETRIGAIPSKTGSVSQSDAAAKLRGTKELELIYTTRTADGKPAAQANLQYVPKQADRFIVDANSGELINLTERIGRLAANAMDAGDAEAASGAASAKQANELTEAELEGASLLKEVLGKDALDQRVRQMDELGMSGFQMTNASYRVDRESKAVSCSLRYVKGEGEARVYKSAVVDAKTGELQSLYTYGDEPKQAAGKYKGETGQKQAQAFLEKYQGARYLQTALYDADDTGNRAAHYIFARQENGYPFPENQFTVGVNLEDGTVESYSQSWTEDITFAGAEGIISAEQALNAYFGTFDVKLGYLAVPVALDPNAYPEYVKAGYTYLYEWRLGYETVAEENCYGVDAKTGDTLFTAHSRAQGLDYSDVTAEKYPQAAALAQYGIGFSGGTFQPDKLLTQEDLLALLLSAEGYVYDPTEEGAQDQLYEMAYRTRLLKRTDRAPEAVVTRTALVKTIIAGSSYGKAAELQGIYRTMFTDQAEIPAADLGYIAIAQGMGLIRGDEHGRFQPGQAATREQGAIVLYNFMSR